MKDLARTVSLASKHIPLTHLNDPTVFESRNGDVGSVIAFKGVPFDTADHDTLNRYKRQWHHALCQLSDAFSVTVHTCRKKVDVALQGEFSDEFTRSVDARYHQRFKNTVLYLTLRPAVSVCNR